MVQTTAIPPPNPVVASPQPNLVVESPLPNPEVAPLLPIQEFHNTTKYSSLLSTLITVEYQFTPITPITLKHIISTI